MTSSLTQPIPTMSVKALPPALPLDHYLVAAYDSTEPFYRRIVVVVPSLTEPTLVMRPRTTKPTRGNVMALAVPHLQELTLPLAQKITGMVTDFITVRELPKENRQRGVIEPGDIVPAPWL